MKFVMKHPAKLCLAFIISASVAMAKENPAVSSGDAEMPPIEIVDVTDLQPRAEPAPAAVPVAPVEPPVINPVSAAAPPPVMMPPQKPITNVMTGLQIERQIQWMGSTSGDSSTTQAAGPAKIRIKISWPGSLVPDWSESDLNSLKQVLSAILSIKPEQVPELKKDAAAATYETEFILKSGLVLAGSESDEQKLLLPHPIRVLTDKIQADATAELGPAGEFRVITRIDHYAAAEHEKDDCRASTRWLTGERLLYKQQQTLVVEDRVLTKAASSQPSDSNKQSALSALKGCSERLAIHWPQGTVADTSAKSASEMTADDELSLRSLPVKTAESIFKRLKYQRLQRKNNPKDTGSLVRQAECYLDLASLDSESANAFADEALEILAAADFINRGVFETETYVQRIRAKIVSGNNQAALQDLTVLQKEAPGSFAARHMSAELSLQEKKLDYAREWAARAGAVAKSDFEKWQAASLQQKIKSSVEEEKIAAKKEREQRVVRQSDYIEEMVEYFDAGDYDQALSLAKEALNLGESQEAREFAGNILDKKIQMIDAEISSLRNENSRAPAAVAPAVPPENQARLAELKNEYGRLIHEESLLCPECEPALQRQMQIHEFAAANDVNSAKLALEIAEKLLKRNPKNEVALQVKNKLQSQQ